VPSLLALARATECLLVVTQPDRPAGRGHKLHAAPVKMRALELGLRVAEPQRVRELVDEVRMLQPDVLAVASYGQILPQRMLDAAGLGALNVHPSLLPLYRGATPLQAQLREGVSRSGVTILLMDAGLDTGDIALQRVSAIEPEETYGSLHDRLAALGADLLGEALAILAAGPLPRLRQRGLAPEDEVVRTATKPLRKGDLEIDWAWSAKRIVDHVRSLAPEPLARARFPQFPDPVKVASARSAARESAGALLVPCGNGEMVALERVVPPSRAPMSGAEFARLLERSAR
jgi:methionyl-tRNA formyltransferase